MMSGVVCDEWCMMSGVRKPSDPCILIVGVHLCGYARLRELSP